MFKLKQIFPIAMFLTFVAWSGRSEATPPYFVVAGGANGIEQETNTWMVCGDCKLLAYQPETGELSLVGQFSNNASDPIFAYVPASVVYDSQRNHISFIASIPPESGSDYSNYAWLITINAKNGKTIHKLRWDIATYGYAMTMIEGE